MNVEKKEGKTVGSNVDKDESTEGFNTKKIARLMATRGQTK